LSLVLYVSYHLIYSLCRFSVWYIVVWLMGVNKRD
jgi:hypothetical protein